jgi:hypothetical protein
MTAVACRNARMPPRALDNGTCLGSVLVQSKGIRRGETRLTHLEPRRRRSTTRISCRRRDWSRWLPWRSPRACARWPRSTFQCRSTRRERGAEGGLAGRGDGGRRRQHPVRRRWGRDLVISSSMLTVSTERSGSPDQWGRGSLFLRAGHTRLDTRGELFLLVTVEAMTTRTAATRMATIQRVQSMPLLPLPPNAV